MIYTGDVKPFKQRHHNTLAIMNEFLILLNTYFMIIYSDFVPDAQIKYLMGWVNLSVIICMVVVNVIELIAIKGYRVYRTVKLKCMGRQRDKKLAKLVAKRSLDKKLRQLDLNLEGMQYGLRSATTPNPKTPCYCLKRYFGKRK